MSVLQDSDGVCFSYLSQLLEAGVMASQISIFHSVSSSSFIESVSHIQSLDIVEGENSWDLKRSS